MLVLFLFAAVIVDALILVLALYRPIKVILGAAMADFDRHLDAANNSGTVSQFPLDRELGRVRASPRPWLRGLRSLAGMFILGGLCITLYNLQGAVRNLGGSFHVLAQSQAAPGAPAVAPGRPNQVVDSMGNLAATAGRAFEWSLGAISIAILLLIDVLVIEWFAGKRLRPFEEDARTRYMGLLPLQTSAAQRVQEQLANTVSQLNQLAGQFNTLNHGLAQLSGFSDTMNRTTASIQDAIQKLPSSIRDSFRDFSDDRSEDMLVESRRQTEHMAALLAIYGQQQTSIATVHSAVNSVRDSTQSVAAAIDRMAPFVDAINTLTGVLAQHHEVTGLLNTATRELGVRVDGLPTAELRKALQDLEQFGLDLIQVREEFVSGAADLHDAQGVLRNLANSAWAMMEALPAEINKLGAPVADAGATLERTGQQITSLNAQVTRQMEIHQRDLKQIRDKQDSLAERIGGLKSALAEVQRHSAEAARAAAQLEFVQRTLDGQQTAIARIDYGEALQALQASIGTLHVSLDSLGSASPAAFAEGRWEDRALPHPPAPDSAASLPSPEQPAAGGLAFAAGEES